MATKKRKPREAFGMIEQLNSGRFRARYQGPDLKRYPAPMTFSTKGDARAWITLQQAAIVRGEWEPPAVARARADGIQAAATETLIEYAETWLRVNRNRRGELLRPRTVTEYRRLLSGPLAEIATLPLVTITAPLVDDWYAAQAESGKITQTSRAYALLSGIMRHAVDRGRIPTSPCRVRGGGAARTGRKVHPPTDAELAVILDSIEPRFRALVHLAADAGLRYGEATDLHRSDVTVEPLDGGGVRVLVSVTHAVTRTRDGFVSGAPKSEAGVRSVYVYGAAADAIAEHLNTHTSRFGDPLLFPANGDETGTRNLSQSTFHTPWWDNARRAAGRPDMPFHALRHYAGTRYTQHGATIAETMARLGHASPAVAMRYQHATGRDAEIAARMAERR